MHTAVLVANRGARQTAGEFARAREMLEARGVHLTMAHVVDDHKDLCRSYGGPSRTGRGSSSLRAATAR